MQIQGQITTTNNNRQIIVLEQLKKPLKLSFCELFSVKSYTEHIQKFSHSLTSSFECLMNFYDLVNAEIVESFLYCLVYIGSRMGSYINLLVPASFYVL